MSAQLLCAPALSARPQVVAVVVDGVTLEDYEQARGPALRRILREGAVGLMTVRTAGPLTLTSACATIGAGARARSERAEETGGLVLEHGELYEGVEAQRLVRARLGIRIEPGSGAYLALPSLKLDNEKELSAPKLGLLGESLERRGLKAAALGNADLPEQARRQAASIAMNARGRIAATSVGAPLYELDQDWPGLFRTNFVILEREFQRLARRADFVVVDLGDSSRLNALALQLDPDVLKQARKRALLSADSFLPLLLSRRAGVERTIILITPTPPAETDSRRLTLAPIVAWGEGFRPGLVTGPSTRTPGLVVNTDIAPTVLHFLGTEVPPEMVGRPISSLPLSHDEKFDFVWHLYRNQTALDVVRQPAQHTLAWGMTATLLVGAAVVLGLLGAWAGRLVAAGCLVWLSGGVGMVLAGMWEAQSAASTVLAALLFTAALIAAGAARRRTAQTVCLLGALVILLDAFFGQRLVKQSILGYSAAAGSRFYGLGNESAGLLLALALASWCFWFEAESYDRRHRVAAALFVGLVSIVILLPFLGANLGMGIASFLAALGAGGRISRKTLPRLMVGAIGLIALVGLAVAFDLILGGPGASHIARAVSGGFQGFAYLVARKAAMNWALLRHSPWALTSLAGLLALLLLRPRLPSESSQATIRGLLVGALAGLILNDSGIVAAGIILGIGACAMFAAQAQERKDEGNGRQGRTL